MKSDKALLGRLQSGDESAWSGFYNLHVQALYNFIRNNGISDPDSIRDVLLEIWAAASKAIANFNRHTAALKTFLFSIACRKISDFWRKHTLQSALPKVMPYVESTQTSLAFRDAITKLPVQERQVLILRHFEGFSVEEIADILDRTHKGAESLLSRACKRLEKEL